jgi:tetratricopeptide (TPR) repeat protein
VLSAEEDDEPTHPKLLKLLAKTKLNLSALYIELRRFPDAKEFAEQSLAILQGEIYANLDSDEIDQLPPREREETLELITTMVIAFYNTGAACEAMFKYDAALEAYRNAANLGLKYLDESVEIVRLARNAYEESRANFAERDRSSVSSRSQVSVRSVGSSRGRMDSTNS